MEVIKTLIRAKGQRLTSQKKEILSVLQQKPQTVYEIYRSLNSKKYSMSKVTVYRILKSFIDLGIVSKVQLKEKEARFELSNREHHHHLVCDDCGSIEDIKLGEETLLKEVKRKSKFIVRSHHLEFFGICNRCQ